MLHDYITPGAVVDQGGDSVTGFLKSITEAANAILPVAGQVKTLMQGPQPGATMPRIVVQKQSGMFGVSSSTLLLGGAAIVAGLIYFAKKR